MLMASGSHEVDITALVKRYGKACLNTSRSEAVLVARLCEVGKALLQEKARTLVANAGSSPILVHFSSDGTPISAKKQFKGSSSKVEVVRQGRDTEEYQVQHVFYRTLDAEGVPVTTTVLRDPLPLTSGKTALAMYSAGVAFFRSARQLGHVGISVCTYTWDRAAYSAQARLWKQHHMMLAPGFAAPSQGLDSDALTMLEWIETTPCCQHDCHNALKWSLHSQFNNSQMMQDMFIVVAAARNSYVLLHQHMALWLQSTIVLIPDNELPPIQDRIELWTALGIEPTLVEVVASELRLQWKDGKLQVAASCVKVPDLLDTVSSALLGLWEFRQFCSSRWVTVGTSCRRLLAAWLSGFDSLVATVRANPKASDWNLHGYEKLTPAMRQFVAIAGMSAYSSEAVLAELMADSRVPRRLPELEEAMEHELTFLKSIRRPIWADIAAVSHQTPGEARTQTLSAAHISNGFLRTKCFNPAKELPWSLGTGDVDENLAQLAAGPEPDQPTANKIWRLVRLGYNRGQLKKGISLLLDAPWGTSGAEQQHASATLLKKFHPEVGQDSLMERAFLHTYLPPPLAQPNHRREAPGQAATEGASAVAA